MSTANAIVAGLDCASPERIADPKDVTPAGDQYSLGCVLYFLLTGGYPFPGKAAVEKMVGHQLKKATPVRELAPEVPEGLAEVVAKLMEKDPAARYASCAEVAAALKPFAELPKRRVTRPVPTLKNLKPPVAIPAGPEAARAEPPQPPSARAAEAARPAPEEPRPAPAPTPEPEAAAAPSLAAWLATLPPGLAGRVATSVGLLAAAALVVVGSRAGWFAFDGEHVRWIPKAGVSALVTGGILTLFLPARKRSEA
jgi:serine/threonine-protein kinase